MKTLSYNLLNKATLLGKFTNEEIFTFVIVAWYGDLPHTLAV